MRAVVHVLMEVTISRGNQQKSQQLKRKAGTGVCAGVWGSKELCLSAWLPLHLLASTLFCGWVPGAPCSAHRPSWTRIVRSNQLATLEQWPLNYSPGFLLQISACPPQQVEQIHSSSHSHSSSVVLAIKCHLRCCIPKYETHCFSPVLFEVAHVDQGYEERIKQKSVHSLWIGTVQITSEVHSDSRLRRWWTERRKRHFLLDWQPTWFELIWSMMCKKIS